MICLEIQNVVYCYFSSVFEQKHCFQPVQWHSGWKLWSGVEMIKVKGQLTEWWRWGGDAVSVRRLNPSSMTPDQKQLMCLQSRAALKWLCVAVKNMWSILWVVICWLWRILWGGSQILRVSWHDEGAVGNGLLDYGIQYLVLSCWGMKCTSEWSRSYWSFVCIFLVQMFGFVVILTPHN